VSDVPAARRPPSNPLLRVATADEVADAALFLARSKYTTGKVLTVDGGFQLM
jgi:NAD(P)-dependent dehydrogenase (short-subunit alcohol dehydrogenase family)